MKKFFLYFSENSAMYVALHAMYKRSRGRKPSAIFGEEHNPKKALQLAKQVLSQGTCVQTKKPCTATFILETMARLNLRAYGVSEMINLLQSSGSAGISLDLSASPALNQWGSPQDIAESFFRSLPWE